MINPDYDDDWFTFGGISTLLNRGLEIKAQSNLFNILNFHEKLRGPPESFVRDVNKLAEIYSNHPEYVNDLCLGAGLAFLYFTAAVTSAAIAGKYAPFEIS